jgi:hypothetical protein
VLENQPWLPRRAEWFKRARQAGKKARKQTTKQTNKQTNKQTSERTDETRRRRRALRDGRPQGAVPARRTGRRVLRVLVSGAAAFLHGAGGERLVHIDDKR